MTIQNFKKVATLIFQDVQIHLDSLKDYIFENNCSILEDILDSLQNDMSFYFDVLQDIKIKGGDK